MILKKRWQIELYNEYLMSEKAKAEEEEKSRQKKNRKLDCGMVK